jgi:hypothetical protein
LSGYTKALIAAAFVTGLGAGVYFDAEINLSPNQVWYRLQHRAVLQALCVVAAWLRLLFCSDRWQTGACFSSVVPAAQLFCWTANFSGGSAAIAVSAVQHVHSDPQLWTSSSTQVSSSVVWQTCRR